MKNRKRRRIAEFKDGFKDDFHGGSEDDTDDWKTDGNEDRDVEDTKHYKERMVMLRKKKVMTEQEQQGV